MSHIHTDPLWTSLRACGKDYKINGIEGEACLFINGRVLAEQGLKERIPIEGEDKIYLSKDGELVAARLSGKALENLKSKLARDRNSAIQASYSSTSSKLTSRSWVSGCI